MLDRRIKPLRLIDQYDRVIIYWLEHNGQVRTAVGGLKNVSPAADCLFPDQKIRLGRWLKKAGRIADEKS